MAYQNLQAEVTEERKTQILDLIKQIQNQLPFLVNLSKDERETIFKMGDKSVAFVEKALEYAKMNPHLVPPYADIPELEQDLALAKQLQPIFLQLKTLFESVSDTYMAAGSEAMTAVTSFYNSVKNAAKSNVPGTDAIYDDLKKRFVKSPAKKEAE
ncbi:MAG TPA: hypothetical protein PK559_08095 [Ignavibacteriaceae bacterium]|nr:hypothetical protein [Ignavibacteriaceae bacterium]